MQILRWVVNKNIAMSKALDRWMWPSMAIDGNRSFIGFVRDMIGTDLVIADVGGGQVTAFFGTGS